MIHIALYQPEIPPNTGNIMRLCVNAGVALHLIHPLGFSLTEKACRRAGLDYQLHHIEQHQNYHDFDTHIAGRRVLACTTKAEQSYSDCVFQSNDVLLFGPETRGLPGELLKKLTPSNCLRIPMQKQSRSINLSNAVAIILYEALRQHQFFDCQ